MLIYDPQYSRFFLGVPGILLAAGALAVIFDAAKWVTAILLAILGAAFIVRAFDIDKTLSSLERLTPTSFIQIFSIIAGVLIILAAIANGISSISHSIFHPAMTTFDILTNRMLIGSFAHGLITLLWIGIATILGGSLLTNWFRGSVRVVSDILRLVVLGLLYIPVLQFTSVLTEGTSPFTLISSLLIGLAVSLVSATFLYQYFRHRKDEGEI
jgi:putative membrane protein